MADPDVTNEATGQELARAREDLRVLRANLAEARQDLDSERKSHEGLKGKYKQLQDQADADKTAGAKALDDLKASHAVALAAEQKNVSGARLQSALGIAATKAGVHNTEDFLALVKTDGIELAEDGSWKGLDEVVAKFKESRPHMFTDPQAAAQTSATKPTTSQGKGPDPKVEGDKFDARTASAEDYAAKRAAYISGKSAA